MRPVLSPAGFKYYALSTPTVAPRAVRKSDVDLKKFYKSEAQRKQILLLQDFGFPTTTTKLRFSPDGNFICGTGAYPPQLRMWETSQMTLKFQRNIIELAKQFLMLSDDFSKLALLHGAKRLELHSQRGSYHQIEFPQLTRDMMYHPVSCEIYGCGRGNINRLNLSRGSFMRPIQTASSSFGCCAINPSSLLLGFGSDDGTVEFYDPRSPNYLGEINVRDVVDSSDLLDDDLRVTSLAFSNDTLTFAVGTSGGHCLLYDVRSPKPYLTKVHDNLDPITKIQFHNGEDRQHVISADQHVIRVWNKQDGETLLSLDVRKTVTDFAIQDGTGLLFAAVDTPSILTWYIPEIGHAPRWCSFLDTLTGELEESSSTSYVSLKFLSRDEVESLGIVQLVGTKFMQPYMHGYYVDRRLYERVSDFLKDPFDEKRKVVEEEMQQTVLQTLLAAPATQTDEIRVNAQMAEELQYKAKLLVPGSEAEADNNNDTPEVAKSVLTDPRWAKLFLNPLFSVREEDKKQKELESKWEETRGMTEAEKFTEQLETEESIPPNSNSSEVPPVEPGPAAPKKKAPKPADKKAPKEASAKKADKSKPETTQAGKKRNPTPFLATTHFEKVDDGGAGSKAMYELKTGHLLPVEESLREPSTKKIRSASSKAGMPLGALVSHMPAAKPQGEVYGNLEMSWVPGKDTAAKSKPRPKAASNRAEKPKETEEGFSALEFQTAPGKRNKSKKVTLHKYKAERKGRRGVADLHLATPYSDILQKVEAEKKKSDKEKQDKRNQKRSKTTKKP
ncbi:Nucleolar protein 10 [Pelomyxa schiedti]|nr:Nucleolar protein 10 [Pelomyxa schiedti]